MSVCRVEVVASTVEDVLFAAAGGADRVEFCAHLASGGLTAGRSLTEEALGVARDEGLGFRVLIRPREGDFVYAGVEREVMIAEAEACLALGVEKVVMGGLDGNGCIDLDLLAEFDRIVGLDHLVFHRALDEAVDHGRARKRLLDAGVSTVLTSGGHARAIDGLRSISESSEAGLTVVAGAGVRPEHAAPLVKAGVEAVHASCRVACGARSGRLFDAARTRVDVERVEALVAAVQAVDRP